jgi:CDP-glucose 4,6-dehydratase
MTEIPRGTRVGSANWEGRRVLVTGASGFVGAQLVDSLSGMQAAVTAVDIRPRPFTAKDAEPVATSIVSVADEEAIHRVLRENKIQIVYHLAAQAEVENANANPTDTFEANVKGTWALLEACRRSPEVERVVVASSDKAYGEQPVLPYTEEMPLLATNPYDASKACADILTTSYHRTYSVPVVITRCANIFGGGDLSFSRLVPGTIRSALAGERPVVRSDGTPLRDYIHISDAVAAYVRLGDAAGTDVVGKAFNFGANQPIDVLQMLRLILVACERPDLEPDIRKTAQFEIQRQYLDSSRAVAVLGWKPQTTIVEGLVEAVGWYRDYLGQALTAG